VTTRPLAVVKVSASPVPKVRVSPAHRAMRRPRLAATARKAHPALKVRAKAAVKADVMVVVQSHAVMRVLTTVEMVRAVPSSAATARKAEVLTAVGKNVANMMATNCHATSIP
jgi:hypothetical protein